MGYPSGGIDVYTTTYTYAAENQANRPICYVAPECTLALSGTTIVTPPTVRGGTDGSIVAAFTSTSGSTATWYLNGTSKGVHASPYTFTGLVAGNYVINVEQLGCEDQSGTIIVTEGEFRTGAFYVSTPQEVSAVENPIILELQTATSSINPKYSINTLTVSGTITAASLEFALTYPQIYNAEFLSKGYPDRQNYFLNSQLTDEVGVPVGTNSLVEIATSLAEALQGDSIISRLYFITNSGTTVTLQAKEYGDMYDLTAANLTVAGGVALSNTQSGVVRYDGQLAADYSLYVELFINPDLQFGAAPVLSAFRRVAELELPFNNSNLHSFDLSTVLKNFVSSPKIDFTFSGFTTLGTMDECYFCKYGEKYPLIENTNTKKKRYKGTTAVLYAINSALNFEDANDMSDYVGGYITNVNPNFNYSLGSGSAPYIVTFNNWLIDTGNTGTTNIKFSIWDYFNTGITKTWQTSNTFTGASRVNAGSYYGRVSGTTDGETFMFSRNFVVNPMVQYQDTNTYTPPYGDVVFLNTAPNPKYIARGSKEFLYMLLRTNYPNYLSLRGDIYFYNGTSTTGVTFFTITNNSNPNNFGGVTLLAAGYDELGLAAYENSGNTKIRRIDFAVWQEAPNTHVVTKLTETRSYLLEIDEQPQKYNVAFLNKLGTYETFSFVGEVVEDQEVIRQNYQVPYTVNSVGQANKGFQYNGAYDTQYTKLITVNSGTIDENTYYYLMDLLASNRIYNYSNVHENFLTVLAQTAQKSSNAAEYTVQVQFKETIFENNVEK